LKDMRYSVAADQITPVRAQGRLARIMGTEGFAAWKGH
jgi:hypothetical protein